MDDPPKAEESEASATERSLAAESQGSADAIDNDSPAEVRVTFIVLMLAAAGLCALPRQWASAGILLGFALLGLVIHLRARATGKG